MKPERLARRALWTANAALAAAILAFAFGVLLAPPGPSPVDDVTPPPPRGSVPPPRPLDVSALKEPNPLTPRIDAPSGTLGQRVRFLDRFGIDGREPAFLLVVSRGVYVNAYRGEPVRTYAGELVPELAGWTLDAFTETGARFTNGRDAVELRRS